MANPYFEPIIGSSFDAIAGQRFGWANFNKSVEEQNLERLQRAQQAQNAYVASVAQMRDAAQQRDINNQLLADESARRDILTQSEAGERARQFNVNATLAETQQENERRKYQFAQDEQKRQENIVKDQTANAADFMLPDVQETGPKFEASQQAAQEALDSATTKRAQLEKDLQGKGIIYDRLAKEFRLQNPLAKATPDIAELITTANDKLAQANADYLTAQREHQANSERWNQLQAQAQKLGLQIGKRGDRYVINSPMHQRTWGDTTATPRLSLDAGVPSWEETSPGSGWLKPASAGNIKAIRPITAAPTAAAVDPGTAVTNPSQYFSPHEDASVVSQKLQLPAVDLGDGTVGTVKSISVGDDRGEWVIPTIVNQKPVSNQQAIRAWKAGQNRAIGGPFPTVKAADDYSEAFHQAESKRLSNSTNYFQGPPAAPVFQGPAPATGQNLTLPPPLHPWFSSRASEEDLIGYYNLGRLSKSQVNSLLQKFFPRSAARYALPAGQPEWSTADVSHAVPNMFYDADRGVRREVGFGSQFE